MHTLEEVAKKGASIAQIALAWSMAQDIVTAPVVGTTSLKHLQDLLGMCLVIKEQSSCAGSYSSAINIILSAEERKYLEELYQPKSVFDYR
jgi:hypothetical protein